MEAGMKRIFWGLLFILFTVTGMAYAADAWKTTVDLDGRHIGSQESNFGNFITDALRNTAKSDIAVIEAAAFQKDALIKSGVLDEQMMRDKLTFPNNPLFILTVKPVVLRNMMERAVSKVPDDAMGSMFLQVSGMVVTFDSSKTAGNWIVSIEVNGKALDFADDKSTFTVAMPGELGKGGQGYFRVFPEKVIGEAKVLADQTVLDAIKSEFTRQKGVISPTTNGRLKDVNPKKDEPKKDK